jgi:hypothetical protein
VGHYQVGGVAVAGFVGQRVQALAGMCSGSTSFVGPALKGLQQLPPLGL